MWNWISVAAQLRQKGRPFALVTITRCSGSTPREPGAKMFVFGEGAPPGFLGTIGGGRLEQVAIEDARACLRDGSCRVFTYPLGAKMGQCCGGTVEVFVEVMNTGPLLYLFGAGHVGQALARTLSGTPFQVHLIDERPEWIRAEQLPPEVIRHECEWTDFASEALWDPTRVYCVVMTFRHDLDQEIVADLLRRPARYVGMIGSRAKWQRFRQRLGARGYAPEELDRVVSPVGLDLGGKAPQEIAISVAADLLARHYGHYEKT